MDIRTAKAQFSIHGKWKERGEEQNNDDSNILR
jgi:hypothetical protein